MSDTLTLDGLHAEAAARLRGHNFGFAGVTTEAVEQVLVIRLAAERDPARFGHLLNVLEEEEAYDEGGELLVDPIKRAYGLLRGLIGTTTSKSLGRPLAAKTIAIRDAVSDLTSRFERMTVRGVFYQLETMRIVPKTIGGYRSVQQQVLRMRRDELLPWSFIADGTRWMRRPDTYDSAEDALAATIATYRQNLWRSQDLRVEVWLEKDTLADMIYPTTAKWQVPLMVSRGQTSDTYAYSAAQETKAAYDAGIKTYIFTLYDSDSYGRDAAVKIGQKIATYSRVPIVCEPLAVTDQQIEAWKLPTRPDKKADREVVELDAIPPDKLIDLVEDAIVALVDFNAWHIEQEYERSERELLERMVAA